MVYNHKASAARETLRKHLPDLDASIRGKALKVLVQNGHLVDDLSTDDALYAADFRRTPMSPIQAAAAEPRRFAEIVGLCRSLGLYIDPASDKKLSLQEIDKCFAGKDVDQRARAKTALFQINLIEA